MILDWWIVRIVNVFHEEKSKKSDIVGWVLLFWDHVSRCKQRSLCCVNDMISNTNSSTFVCWVNNCLEVRCWRWIVIGWTWVEFSWLHQIGQLGRLFSPSSSHASPITSTIVLCCRSEFKNYFKSTSIRWCCRIRESA